MKAFCTIFILVVLLAHAKVLSQINPDHIDIVRDQWGVPHIFAATDAEVAYGFGWATAEDDFKTIQQQLLPVRGLAGLLYKRDGAALDVAFHLIDAEILVERAYATSLSPVFRNYLKAYCDGINAYAKHHKKEVLYKKLFPIQGKDVIKAFVLGLTQLTHADRDLRRLVGGRVASLPEGSGSNAFAISAKKTSDGKTYLAINSHQPLEGPNSWYEAHLCSDEGLNILGATFAGSPVISIGTNEYLGWGHTLNYPDLSDIFQLEMHPANKLFYRFDGKWEKLEEYDIKAKIKLWGLVKIGAIQKFYKSKYGVTYATTNGFFAHRFSANRDIRAAEQWYWMNRARNWEEFMTALKLQGLPSMNIVYADRDDHIYYLSNGRFPIRAKGYDWKSVVPGNSSATLWPDDYYPIDSLPQVLDPKCGFVFNCNNSPFFCTIEAENPNILATPVSAGFQSPQDITNRAVRLSHLLNAQKEFSYDDFKRIKYDLSYHNPMLSAPKLEPIFHLDPEAYPQLKENIQLLATWDRVAKGESSAASIFILAVIYVRRTVRDLSLFREGDAITEKLLVDAIGFAQDHCLRFFGVQQIPLNQLQKHARGSVILPVEGGPDVLAALSASLQPDGTLKARAGDSYIELVRYSKNGVEIETVNAYGASAKPDSPHYTDQMDMYVNRKLKTMTLNKEEIYRNARSIYHPGQL